ncbi:hypothetical protein WJX72_010253 [[Myrmecia] bisecta]|uniref:Uncharacterized protein n=1 Tax=[Myrmecia] bisecta TaxID=41462 RepID=A0AAW1R9I7_9CHLO
MGGYCSKAKEELCGKGGCGFTCQCVTCGAGDRCDCSCRWLVVGGMAFTVLAFMVWLVAYRERRKWLTWWSGAYTITGVLMTTVTYLKGPDPHDVFGCSVPCSLWLGSLFVATLSYYTTDYMRQGNDTPSKEERYVYDPQVGEYVRLVEMNEYHVV